jgi:translation initiation factor IF-3
VIRLDEVKDKLVNELEVIREARRTAQNVIMQTDWLGVDQEVTCVLITEHSVKSPAKKLVEAAKHNYNKAKRQREERKEK